MPNLILEFVAAISAICGLIVLNFLLIIYVSVKRLGGSLEKRHVYVIGSVALVFFLVSILLYFLGNITA